jgi:hypothetical protein
MRVNILGFGLLHERVPDRLADLVLLFEVKWSDNSLFSWIDVAALRSFASNGGPFDDFLL